MDCCEKKKIDYLFWGSSFVIFAAYLGHYILQEFNIENSRLMTFTHSNFELINKMWLGLILGIIAMGVLSKVPKEFVISLLGTGNKVSGVFRATLAGLLLDLCSHGILMVGMKLYERGASVGQVMAFLIASPWNSLSLTIILIALIGLKWTLLFVVLSAIVAIISGLIFELLVEKKVLPANPHTISLPEEFSFRKDAVNGFKDAKFDLNFFKEMSITGIKESRMILRWIFFGVVVASLVRTFISPENFQQYFGPSLLGLGMTLIAATIIEVCSEGSTPIAAELVNQGGALGNGFAFLMTGVSTDYTEIMALKERTRSWKVTLFLPLLTLPQIIILSYILNNL